MTVENTQNKMPPLQMGTATEYPFTFAVLLQDPTEEEALEAIKASVLQADGTEIELEYGTDYTVTLNTDRIGGTLTVNNVRTSDDYITIYRQYEQTQEVDYKDFNAAPAETFEQCFDKLTMLSQQQQEEINRSLKLNVSSTTVNPTLPEPLANNTLIWDSVGSSLKNYDIIGENNQFKAEVNSAIAAGQADIQAQFDAFENMIDTEIEDVREAATKINQLEESVATATTAATNAQNSATNALNSANAASQLVQDAEETLQTRANLDLSNLSETGEKHFLNKTQITNCLLEVPQNINLELSDGVLTLKAGSKVIVPNGFEADGTTQKFYVITVLNDLLFGGSGVDWSSTKWLVRKPDGTLFVNNGDYVSGTTYSGGTYGVWYDTANNLIKHTSDGGSTWISGYSLPLAQITTTSGTGITSIDQIFNGMGYIGSTIWVDKGVKGLIPDGRNEDGTLNNIEVVTNKVLTRTVANNVSVPITLFLNPTNTGLFIPPTSQVAYDEINNILVNNATAERYYSPKLATFDTTNGVVSNFNPKQPFRAVDYSDSSTVSGWAFPSDNYIDLEFGASGSEYTAPANGWFMANTSAASSSRSHLSFTNKHSGFGIVTTCYTEKSGNRITTPAKKDDVVQLFYSNVTSGTIRFYYAEGEV